MKTLLLEVLASPHVVTEFDIGQWKRLLREAYGSRSLARLGYVLNESGVSQQLPLSIQQRLEWNVQSSRNSDQSARWECHMIAKALREIGVPLVLLKGAAYLLAGLPPSRGRFFADIDILVEESQLDRVEQIVMKHGWCHVKPDAYEQKYYREMMHQLPPMTHQERGTSIDIHHTILPRTSQLCPKPAAFLEDAVKIANTDYFTLCPADMVLHSATHLFHDGVLIGEFQNLLDIHLLLKHFGQGEGFWISLRKRAEIHGLEDPLRNALRYSEQMLGTNIPSHMRMESHSWGQKVLDWAVPRTILVAAEERKTFLTWLASIMMYSRSHLLRMPLRILIPHAIRQTYKWFKADSSSLDEAV